jgi:predicted amidohydrolase YtcJ
VSGLLLRDAEVSGAVVDVRIAGGRVAEIGPALDRSGEEELRCGGSALVPGLHDAHLHLLALAAARRSVACGPPVVTGPAGLARALADAPSDAAGWVRGVGYVESVAGDLDAGALDGMHADRPVRLQHRSGALWMLNSRAVEALDLAGADAPGIERDAAGRPTGRLWRADAELRRRLPPDAPPDLAAVGAELLRLGVTAVTDATPDLGAAALGMLSAARETGALPQRLHLLGAPDGAVVTGATTGPVKLVLADSGLPALDDLTARIAAAHATGRPVAVHCVTREALVLLLAALDDAGGLHGDRIEHASLVPAELVPELARRGLTVVTQPGFLADRGDDYLRDVPAAEHPDLYRCASLRAAGVPLALSSDAPYGPLDPWAVMAAAVGRRTRDGRVVGEAERMDPGSALAGWLGTPEAPARPRRLAPGLPADLVLLAAPLADVLAAPAGAVRTVVLGGRPAG